MPLHILVNSSMNFAVRHYYKILHLGAQYTQIYYRQSNIRGLMRGMATLPQGSQELSVVRDKVGRLQVSLG